MVAAKCNCVCSQIVLVLPATNASSEWSFSAMRCVKTYLQSIMSQGPLNHLILLPVHKALTGELSLVNVVNDSVALKIAFVFLVCSNLSGTFLHETVTLYLLLK